MIIGSDIFFINTKPKIAKIAINAVHTSIILFEAIIITAPTNAPITAAVIPVTKVFID